jgi:hypothetical protein
MIAKGVDKAVGSYGNGSIQHAAGRPIVGEGEGGFESKESTTFKI